ncbi:serine/threonine-protein kinase pim-2-like [Menidia menidia]
MAGDQPSKEKPVLNLRNPQKEQGSLRWLKLPQVFRRSPRKCKMERGKSQKMERALQIHPKRENFLTIYYTRRCLLQWTVVILKQLVVAAIHLKEKSIFHRDIKVENILIETSTDVPRVRLIDFGLSCFVKTKSRYRVFYGTSAHVPPEWLNSHSYTAGPTTVWQMGVVLFETLHNKEFKSTRFVSKRLRISNRLSQDCQGFLEQCLTHHPEQRPTLEQLQRHPWFTRNRHDI